MAKILKGKNQTGFLLYKSAKNIKRLPHKKINQINFKFV